MMVNIRTSSKKSGTGSTPLTNSRNVTSLLKDGVGIPCLVAKTMPKSRPKGINEAVDTSPRKKKEDEKVIVDD